MSEILTKLYKDCSILQLVKFWKLRLGKEI